MEALVEKDLGGAEKVVIPNFEAVDIEFVAPVVAGSEPRDEQHPNDAFPLACASIQPSSLLPAAFSPLLR